MGAFDIRGLLARVMQMNAAPQAQQPNGGLIGGEMLAVAEPSGNGVFAKLARKRLAELNQKYGSQFAAMSQQHGVSIQPPPASSLPPIAVGYGRQIN